MIYFLQGNQLNMLYSHYTFYAVDFQTCNSLLGLLEYIPLQRFLLILLSVQPFFQQVAPHHEVQVSHSHIMDIDANDQLCSEGGFCLRPELSGNETNWWLVFTDHS